MFRVNNKDSRMTAMGPNNLVSFMNVTNLVSDPRYAAAGSASTL